ncbi:MAG: hypothetical protein QM817_19110 [Archangium sp.]
MSAHWLVVAVTLLAGPPKAAKPKPAPEPPPAKALAEVKAGDYVEYAITASSDDRRDMMLMMERRGPLKVRLTAVEVTDDDVLIDVHATTETARAWLKPGLSFRVKKGGKPVEGPLGIGVVPVSKKVAEKDLPPFVEKKFGDVTVRCRPYDFDHTRGDGPKGNGCADSPDAALALGDGIVESHSASSGFGGFWSNDVVLVGVGNAPLTTPVGPLAYPEGGSWTTLTRVEINTLQRQSVTSAAGKLVHVSARYDVAEPGDKVAFSLAGKDWKLIHEQPYAISVLSEITGELGSSDWPPTPAPKMGVVPTPGPPCDVGPKKVATSQLKVPEPYGQPFEEKKPAWLITFFADPSSVPEAPLPVRYGIIEEEDIYKSRRYRKIVEWK